MTTEENKRMLALSCIVADLKAENMELLERMQNISAEFADVLCRLNEKERRKNDCILDNDIHFDSAHYFISFHCSFVFPPQEK